MHTEQEKQPSEKYLHLKGTHCSRQESMWVQDECAHEVGKSTGGQFVQSDCCSDVTMWLWYQNTMRKHERVLRPREENGLYWASKPNKNWCTQQVLMTCTQGAIRLWHKIALWTYIKTYSRIYRIAEIRTIYEEAVWHVWTVKWKIRNWRAYYPKQKGAKNLTDVQLKKAINQLEEKHNAIMFLYKADR